MIATNLNNSASPAIHKPRVLHSLEPRCTLWVQIRSAREATMSQSSVPIATIMKTAPKLLERPRYAKNVAMLQVDRFLWNLTGRHRNGKAGRIRQCSIRITDICNLRCHTCGQWGDQGFLRGCSLKDLR